MKHSRENTEKGSKRGSIKINESSSYNSNYQSSETIVKSIIDKITIYAFYKGFSKETDKNLGNFCYDHIKKEITSFFELNFINYTGSNNDNNPELLWEMEPPIENTWEEILEPESEPIDRYESAQIIYQEIKRDNNNINNNNQQIKEKEKEKKKSSIKNKNKITLSDNKNRKVSDLNNNNNNIINEVEEKSSISGFEGEVKIEKEVMLEVSGIEDKFSESSNKTDAEIKKNIDKVEIIENNTENKIIRKEEKKITKNNPRIQITRSNELPPLTRRNRNSMIVNYPSVDIPGLEQEFDHQNLEPSNVELLRQERDELIKKKIIEEKAEKIINKAKRVNNDNDKKPKKILDTKHLTFDSNGNIINFHPYKLDKLKKEFTLIKNLIKGEPKQEGPKQKPKNNYLSSYRTNKKESTKNDEEKKVKELVEKPEQIFEEKPTRERERYIPSGSNFQIISPNIGVIIKENNKLKQGSKEFSKYFQKYSIRDYDKMLTDFVPLQNKTLIQNKLKKLNSSASNDYISTIPNNYTTKLSKKSSNNSLGNSYDLNTNNINNPLLTDIQGINNSNINTINNNININTSLSNNNPLLSSNFKTINYNNNNNSIYKSINTENSIVMKKLGMSSLKLELESLKDLNTINPEIFGRTNRVNNLFRYNSYKDFKRYRAKNENKVNVFTELNRKIMNSRDWGNEIGNKKNANTDMGFSEDNNKRYGRHITKQQILRELGSNILSGIKIRLPRDRKVDINENI